MNPALVLVIALVGLAADVVIVLGFLASLNKISKAHAREEGVNSQKMVQFERAISEIKKYCDELDVSQREEDKRVAELTGKVDAMASNITTVVAGQGKLEGMMVRHLEDRPARRKA